MIVDSSALVSILLSEPDAPDMASALTGASHLRMSAATLLELSMVVDGRGIPEASARLDTIVDDLKIQVVPFDAGMAALARTAFRQYGRRSQSPAKLNFGDCMAYALAKSTGEPLLFKGNDFIHTDITPAIA